RRTFVERAELLAVQRNPAQCLFESLLPARLLLIILVGDTAVLDEKPPGQPFLAQCAVFAGLQDEVMPDLVDVLLDRQKETAEPVAVPGDEIEIAQALGDLPRHELPWRIGPF